MQNMFRDLLFKTIIEVASSPDKIGCAVLSYTRSTRANPYKKKCRFLFLSCYLVLYYKNSFCLIQNKIHEHFSLTSVSMLDMCRTLEHLYEFNPRPPLTNIVLFGLFLSGFPSRFLKCVY